MKKKIIFSILFLVILSLGVGVYYQFFSATNAKNILRNEILNEKSKCVNSQQYSEERCLLIMDCVADKVVNHYSNQRGFASFAREVKSGKVDLLSLGIVKSFSSSCALEITIEKDFFEEIN